MTLLGESKHFSGKQKKNGALGWSILVGKQEHNAQKPTCETQANSQTRVIASTGYASIPERHERL